MWQHHPKTSRQVHHRQEPQILQISDSEDEDAEEDDDDDDGALDTGAPGVEHEPIVNIPSSLYTDKPEDLHPHVCNEIHCFCHDPSLTVHHCDRSIFLKQLEIHNPFSIQQQIRQRRLITVPEGESSGEEDDSEGDSEDEVYILPGGDRVLTMAAHLFFAFAQGHYMNHQCLSKSLTT